MTADRIVLSGVGVEALIGVFEHERHAKRPLTIDLELACDLAPATRSDALADTVDYFGLVARIRERCAASSWRLLEALAAEIATTCLDEPRVLAVTVTVHKPGCVEGVADVAVVLQRTRA